MVEHEGLSPALAAIVRAQQVERRRVPSLALDDVNEVPELIAVATDHGVAAGLTGRVEEHPGFAPAIAIMHRAHDRNVGGSLARAGVPGREEPASGALRDRRAVAGGAFG